MPRSSQALIDVYAFNGLDMPDPTKKDGYGMLVPIPHYEWEGIVCNNAKCIEKIFFETMGLSQLPKVRTDIHEPMTMSA